MGLLTERMSLQPEAGTVQDILKCLLFGSLSGVFIKKVAS